jgi:hypothetical protein
MSLLAKKHADEIREMWQSRALKEAGGKLQRVLLIALAKEYPADLLLLLKATFGTIEIPMPFYSGYAMIVPSGHLACMMHDRDAGGLTWKGVVKVYDSEQKFLAEARRLADGLKLVDADRIEMFAVLQRWVASDQRVDHQGRKLAS